MTNALTDVLAVSDSVQQPLPDHGDVVLAPQVDGGCLLGQHPGEWQIAFGSHSEAVRVAVGYAHRIGARVWLQTGDQYAPIGAGDSPAGDMS